MCRDGPTLSHRSSRTPVLRAQTFEATLRLRPFQVLKIGSSGNNNKASASYRLPLAPSSFIVVIIVDATIRSNAHHHPPRLSDFGKTQRRLQPAGTLSTQRQLRSSIRSHTACFIECVDPPAPLRGDPRMRERRSVPNSTRSQISGEGHSPHVD